MKEHWNEIWKQLETTDSQLMEYIHNGALSTMSLKRIAQFSKEWNALKKMAAEFDNYIAPVEPLDIKYPFESEAFRTIWTRWCEYLAEQHGQLIRTRSEQSALENLAELAQGDEQRAIKYVRYAMANRYKNLFAIEEKKGGVKPMIDYKNTTEPDERF